jgi:hypothetical protein
MKNLYEAVGWYGVLAILAAYALSNFELLKLDSPAYIILNLTGSLAIALEASKKKDYQPVILNVVWLLVALIALGRLVFTS